MDNRRPCRAARRPLPVPTIQRSNLLSTRKFSDDAKLSSLGVTASVVDGKVTLMGSVQSAADKSLAEKAVRNVKGVKSVDNQIIVSG